MVVALATLYSLDEVLIVQRSDKMSITYKYEIGEGTGTLKVDLCSQGAQFQSEILKFLGNISKGSNMRVDQMDLNQCVRFRILWVEKKFLGRIEKFASKMRQLVEKDE